MYIFDNEITLEGRERISEYLDSYEYETSGLSFSSLYMWRNINRFRWDIIGDYMCISGVGYLDDDGSGGVHSFMFPPLTKTGTYESKSLRKTIYECKEIYEKNGEPFSLRLVPESIMQEIKKACPEIVFKDDRDNYDYVYCTQDLVEFKGRAYHSKKNHLNYFKKTYDYEYQEMTSYMADEAMVFIKEFNAKKNVPENEMKTLKMEEEAMRDVFKNLEVAGYKAGVIRIDGKIQALAVGGRLGKETVTEHIEKANTSYRGLYQAMLNEFCKNIAGSAKYLNREEDMGIANLRKAKLSYKPVKLVKKYIGKYEKEKYDA